MIRIFIASIFSALASSANADIAPLFANPEVSVDGSAYFASSTVLGVTSGIFARITVQDVDSGVDTSLVSARYTTDGMSTWAAASIAVSLVPGGSTIVDPFFLVASGLDLADSMTLNYVQFTAYDIAGNSASSTFRIETHLNVPEIPEPDTYAMMAAGLGLLGVAARRRRQKEAAA